MMAFGRVHPVGLPCSLHHAWSQKDKNTVQWRPGRRGSCHRLAAAATWDGPWTLGPRCI